MAGLGQSMSMLQRREHRPSKQLAAWQSLSLAQRAPMPGRRSPPVIAVQPLANESERTQAEARLQPSPSLNQADTHGTRMTTLSPPKPVDGKPALPGAKTPRAERLSSPPQSDAGSTEPALRTPIVRFVQRPAGSGWAAKSR